MDKAAERAAKKGAEKPPAERAEAAGADPQRDDFVPRLRILNKQSWRGSFRLEEIFWSILEEAAQAQGRRLNEYVHDLLAAAPEEANKSSLLRAYAAKWQRERTRAASAGLPPAAAGAVAACPVACFVMGEDKRIRLFNSRFLDFLRGPNTDAAALAGSSPRMTFQMPLPEVVETLRAGSGKVVECGLQALVLGRTVHGRARICLIEDGGGTDWRIMVFVAKG